ncbi:MAG TPA: sodium:solute symporter family protein [Acidobacteriota bacterium]|nr:sodium:solute symporter family protein [Acidobacteriota bacterium]
MELNWIDWTIVVLYFLASLVIGLYFSGRAGKDTESFFLSGRSMPWWLIGTSMVATTFAADTPLAVTGMVARHGIAGNWLWWNFAFSGMLTVFFYARLWRRAEVMTDVEFTEIRYSGVPAAVLRGFRAIYLALPINCIVMGWVILAMSKILEIILVIDKWEAIFLCLVITLSYSVFSGLWGVLVTDFVQFILAMTGSIALAYFAVNAVGGLAELKTRVADLPIEGSALSFIPETGSAWMPLITFFVYIAVNWWATWYPGAEPGGGGFIAQRMFSAKNESHSLAATLYFNFANYVLRPWPWILVALVAMVLYPDLEDKESGYVIVMVNHLPHFFRGLVLASFLAAFMSTVSTSLNWGASYLVNDLYRRFLIRDRSERHYVRASRVFTLLVMLAAAIVTYFLSSVEGAWKLLIAIGAGTGPVYLLRWYWWRVNAWSEVAAMTASFTISIFFQSYLGLDSDDPRGFAYLMLWTVGLTTVCWVLVTFLTKPEPDQKLLSFYRQVRPSRTFWKPIADRAPEVEPDRNGTINLINWLLGCIFIFCSLFGVGKLILASYWEGLLYLIPAALSVAVIFRNLGKQEHALGKPGKLERVL